MSTGPSISESPEIFVVKVQIDRVYSGILWHVVSGGFIATMIINMHLGFFFYCNIYILNIFICLPSNDTLKLNQISL